MRIKHRKLFKLIIPPTYDLIKVLMTSLYLPFKDGVLEVSMSRLALLWLDPEKALREMLMVSKRLTWRRRGFQLRLS